MNTCLSLHFGRHRIQPRPMRNLDASRRDFCVGRAQHQWLYLHALWLADKKSGPSFSIELSNCAARHIQCRESRAWQAHVSWLHQVDGGVGRACRGDEPSDNSDDYYVVVASQTIQDKPGQTAWSERRLFAHVQECQAACAAAPSCNGIEFSRWPSIRTPLLYSLAASGTLSWSFQ